MKSKYMGAHALSSGGFWQGIPHTAGAKRVVTSLPDACHEKDWRLAWSVTDVVPESALPRQHAWTPLGLRSPPLLATVGATILYCMRLYYQCVNAVAAIDVVNVPLE